MDSLIQQFANNLHFHSFVLTEAVFIMLRALSAIIPPIPGGVVDLIGIPLFGWLKSFFLAECGIIIGASASFSIARYFREPILRRFTSLQKIHEWEQELSHTEKFWSLVALRLPSNLFFDYINYAAGLTKISFPIFIGSTIVGNLPSVFLFYVISGLAYKHGGGLQAIVAAVGLVILTHLVYRLYKRKKKI